MIELTLPLPPNRGNARDHWAVSAKKKKAYTAECALACFEIVNTQPPFRGRVRISMDFYVWSLNDWDNLVNRAKWAWDALVKFGIIKDDSPKYVDLGDVTQTVDRKDQRLELSIEEVEDA